MSTFTLTTAVTPGVPSPLPFVATVHRVALTRDPVQVNASDAFSGHEGTAMSTSITVAAVAAWPWRRRLDGHQAGAATSRSTSLITVSRRLLEAAAPSLGTAASSFVQHPVRTDHHQPTRHRDSRPKEVTRRVDQPVRRRPP